MRIMTGSTLTAQDIYHAATEARVRHGQDIYVDDVAVSPRGAITFYGYSIGGKRASNGRPGERAASWTAWGYLIAYLYTLDANAKIGPYKGADDFAAQCRSWQPRGASLDFLAVAA